MAPFAFPSRNNETAVFQHFHVMGKRWLSDLHLLQQLACALLSISQKINDLKPVLIRQRFADEG
jgi:hypothetical protein